MNQKQVIFIASLTAITGIGVGVIIGYFSRSTSSESPYNVNHFADNQDIMNDALDSVDPSSIRSYLEVLSQDPHIAAMDRDDQLTDWISDEWLEAGLDHVETPAYDFYLSWPNQTHPNKISLLDENDGVHFVSHHKEEEVRPGDAHPDFVHAFLAYSPAAEVTGQLIYVNYGRVEDLDYLETLNISVAGKICMARYGGLYRGNKLRNCEDRGAIGLIIFSDPADVAPFGTSPEDVYPNTIYLPGTGMQRGTVLIDNGDPLSPMWPSVENAYRISKAESTNFPKIPCHAKVLLEKMGGPESPPTWRGGIEGVTYNIGGEMAGQYSGWKVQLSVNNYEQDTKSRNVIGYLRGSVEPDRYVYLGNHRDAWGYGAVDPSSGTASLMEVVRVLGGLRRAGWRPRRTIVFCSWAVEEYSLMGSEEWVQDNINKIMERSVAMLNVDICVQGSIPAFSSSPSLKSVVERSLKNVDHWGGQGSVYDFWYSWLNDEGEEATEVTPQVSLLGSGSDHTNFVFFAGIPSIDMTFEVDSKEYGVSSYPAYHTGIETFFLVDQLVDPGFQIHKTCTQMSLHQIFQLSESLILPYNVSQIGRDMRKYMDELLHGEANETLTRHDITLEHVDEAVSEFEVAAQTFSEYVANLDRNSDTLTLKMVNDLLLKLERVFLLPQGLPGQPKFRHAIFSPARFDSYSGSAFPGISDLLYRIDDLTGDDLDTREKELKRHVSDLMIVINNAASFLNVNLFMI